MNVTTPLRLQFPSAFIAAVERQYPKPVFENARHLYPGPEPVLIPPGYHEVVVAPHPLQFVPYQYEGYTAQERQVLRSEDIRMRAFAPRR